MADQTVKPRTSRRNQWLVIGAVLVALAAALVLLTRREVKRDESVAGGATTAKPQASDAPSEAAPRKNLVDDDGDTLWVSPTDGPPLQLAGLPPGVEVILALRPSELLAHPEGEKVVAALGPLGQAAHRLAEERLAMPLAERDRMFVGWQRDAAAGWQAALIAPPAGSEPPLPRDVERILAHTDASRHVTLVFQPPLLFVHRQNAFAGEFKPLKAAVEWFLGDHVAAAALSAHWDENFFLELVVLPTLDSSPRKKCDELEARLNRLPETVEKFVLELNPSPYGRRIIARLPSMVRTLAAYSRCGVEGDCAVLRCYLPAVAGHNLIMGAELALAAGQGSGGQAASTPIGTLKRADSISARLQRPTTLRFAREELEAALNMLGQDIGVTIVIRGQDLQLDGITRNQLFAIDMADRPAEEILLEILRRANPDKSATGPADPRQKLVYVVGPDAVIITTRTAAAKRGERLPAVFAETP